MLLQMTPQQHYPANTILVVEDYGPSATVAILMLEHLGFNVIAAENGHQAVVTVWNAATPFAAILMDLQMNDMDGFETTRRIREIESERGFRHPIIGVTAHALTGDRERCLAAGMDDYISKPVHPEILASTLRRFLPESHISW